MWIPSRTWISLVYATTWICTLYDYTGMADTSSLGQFVARTSSSAHRLFVPGIWAEMAPRLK